MHQAVVFNGPARLKMYATVVDTVLHELKRRERVPFVYNRKLYSVASKKLPALYKAYLTDSINDNIILFGRYGVQSIPTLTDARRLPHSKRVKIPLHWKSQVELYLSMVMTSKPTYYSIPTLQSAVAAFFGTEYADYAVPVLARWLNRNRVVKKDGQFSGVGMYKYIDKKSGMHAFNTTLFKRG